MTRAEIEKVARAVLGPDEDLRGLDERALMMVTVARRLGKLPLEQQGDAYLNEAFAKIAHSVSGLRRDETRLDDPKLDAALDPRTASIEALAERAKKARADAARDAEGAYLQTLDAGERRPEPRPVAKADGGAGTAEAARARMLRDLEAAAGRGE